MLWGLKPGVEWGWDQAAAAERSRRRARGRGTVLFYEVVPKLGEGRLESGPQVANLPHTTLSALLLRMRRRGGPCFGLARIRPVCGPRGCDLFWLPRLTVGRRHRGGFGSERRRLSSLLRSRGL